MPNPVYTYMICKLKSTKLNGSKYCYVSLKIQLTSVICLQIVKWSNSSISYNSI